MRKDLYVPARKAHAAQDVPARHVGRWSPKIVKNWVREADAILSEKLVCERSFSSLWEKWSPECPDAVPDSDIHALKSKFTQYVVSYIDHAPGEGIIM